MLSRSCLLQKKILRWYISNRRPCSLRVGVVHALLLVSCLPCPTPCAKSRLVGACLTQIHSSSELANNLPYDLRTSFAPKLRCESSSPGGFILFHFNPNDIPLCSNSSVFHCIFNSAKGLDTPQQLSLCPFHATRSIPL